MKNHYVQDTRLLTNLLHVSQKIVAVLYTHWGGGGNGIFPKIVLRELLVPKQTYDG